MRQRTGPTRALVCLLNACLESNELEDNPVAFRASCLCGGVTLRLDSVVRMGNCHCSICRKAHGGAFATFAIVPIEHYHLLSGQNLIADFRSSKEHVRYFCSVCGSSLPYQTKPNFMDVPASLLDDDPGVRPGAHIFATSRAPWFQILDDLPQYDGWSRGPDGKPLEPLPRDFSLE